MRKLVLQKPGSAEMSAGRGPGAHGRGRRTVEHDGRGFEDFCDITRLLLELSDGGLLGRLALVNQAGGQLDDGLANGRAVLFLEDNFRTCERLLVR